MDEFTKPKPRPNRKTDEITTKGRPVWVDGSTGEKYSERSVTFPVEEGGKKVWYTFPTVAEDGTQYDEDTIRKHVQTNGPIDWITGEAFPNFESQDEAVNYAKERSGSLLSNTQQYAKGGEVSQMNKMFEEGGLATDGMGTDPVSGNDIPVGSNAKDVRDDVDAKLSEGEYVVPADVVKYFGVAYFEKLRSKAKEGLAGMNKDGRIGGNIDDEDMEGMEEEHTLGGDLTALDGYATGGLVSGMDVNGIIDRVKAAAVKDPSITEMLKSKGIFVQGVQPQAKPKQQDTNTPAAFAEGGLVPYGTGEYTPSLYKSDFNVEQYKPGFSIYDGGYESTKKDEVLPTCQPGYHWDATTKACVADVKEASSTRLNDDERRGNDRDEVGSNLNPDGSTKSWTDSYDLTDPKSVFDKTMESFAPSTGVMGLISGVAGMTRIGSVVQGLSAIGTVNRANAMANYLDSINKKEEAAKIRAEAAKHAEKYINKNVPKSFYDGSKLEVTPPDGTTPTPAVTPQTGKPSKGSTPPTFGTTSTGGKSSGTGGTSFVGGTSSGGPRGDRPSASTGGSTSSGGTSFGGATSSGGPRGDRPSASTGGSTSSGGPRGDRPSASTGSTSNKGSTSSGGPRGDRPSASTGSTSNKGSTSSGGPRGDGRSVGPQARGGLIARPDSKKTKAEPAPKGKRGLGKK